jgi:predicted O-methyltransferase YrrM
MERHPYYCFEILEAQRKKLLTDSSPVILEDAGTGSDRTTTIGCIARTALKPARQAQLLFRICARYKFKTIMELGTSLGITTLYLAGADQQINCVSIEASASLSNFARQQAIQLGMNNIRFRNENLDSKLYDILSEYGTQDLIFMDANHRYESVIKYFNECINFIHPNSIIVVDDPYWSEGMTRAWNDIKQDARVHASIDLYHMGILFFNPSFAKKQYRIRL